MIQRSPKLQLHLRILQVVFSIALVKKRCYHAGQIILHQSNQVVSVHLYTYYNTNMNKIATLQWMLAYNVWLPPAKLKKKKKCAVCTYLKPC